MDTQKETAAARIQRLWKNYTRAVNAYEVTAAAEDEKEEPTQQLNSTTTNRVRASASPAASAPQSSAATNAPSHRRGLARASLAIQKAWRKYRTAAVAQQHTPANSSSEDDDTNDGGKPPARAKAAAAAASTVTPNRSSRSRGSSLLLLSGSVPRPSRSSPHMKPAAAASASACSSLSRQVAVLRIQKLWKRYRDAVDFLDAEVGSRASSSTVGTVSSQAHGRGGLTGDGHMCSSAGGEGCSSSGENMQHAAAALAIQRCWREYTNAAEAYSRAGDDVVDDDDDDDDDIDDDDDDFLETASVSSRATLSRLFEIHAKNGGAAAAAAASAATDALFELDALPSDEDAEGDEQAVMNLLFDGIDDDDDETNKFSDRGMQGGMDDARAAASLAESVEGVVVPPTFGGSSTTAAASKIQLAWRRYQDSVLALRHGRGRSAESDSADDNTNNHTQTRRENGNKASNEREHFLQTANAVHLIQRRWRRYQDAVLSQAANTAARRATAAAIVTLQRWWRRCRRANSSATTSQPAATSAPGTWPPQSNTTALSALRTLQRRVRARYLRRLVHERDRHAAAASVQSAWRVFSTRRRYRRELRRGTEESAARDIQDVFRNFLANRRRQEQDEEEGSTDLTAASASGGAASSVPQSAEPTAQTTAGSSAVAATAAATDATSHHHLDRDGDDDESALPACAICLCEKVGCVVLPCRHAKYCVSCAQQLRRCAICRERIALRIAIFL